METEPMARTEVGILEWGVATSVTVEAGAPARQRLQGLFGAASG